MTTENEAPLRVMVISDTHLCAPGTPDGKWRSKIYLSKARELSERMLEYATKLRPQLIIHCGDITEHGLESEIAEFVSLPDRTGVPWIAVRGNHDMRTPAVGLALSARFGELNCVVEMKGYRFVLLDPGMPDIAGMYEPDLDFLSTSLSPTLRDRTILVTHFPPEYGRYPDYPYLIGGWQSPAPLWRSVKNGAFAVLTGHFHVEDRFRKDHLDCLYTSSSCEYPFRFRMLEILPGRICSQSYVVPGAPGIITE